jgi:hypothetical protein
MYNFSQFNQRGIFFKFPICYFDNFEEGPGSNENPEGRCPRMEITTGMVKTSEEAP